MVARAYFKISDAGQIFEIKSIALTRIILFFAVEILLRLPLSSIKHNLQKNCYITKIK